MLARAGESVRARGPAIDGDTTRTNLFETGAIRVATRKAGVRPQQRPQPAAPAGSKPQILAVEDDPHHAELEREILARALAADVTVEGTGRGALRAIALRSFDLVLVDFRLPDMNGVALVRLLRDLDERIPLIMLTAAGSEAIAVEAMKEGATDYLVKDFGERGAGDLVRAAWRALSHARLGRAYERARELFEETYEQTWDGIAYVDAQGGRIISANGALGRLVGRTPSELAGRPFEELVALEDRPSWRTLLAALADTRRQEGEARLAAAAGGEPVACEVRLVRLTTGPEPAALLTIRDVTEKRRLEAQLLRAQRIEALGLLAGGVAHEFNNQLAVIMGYAALLAEGEKGRLSPRGAVAIEAIDAAARTAADVTRRLLAFARGGGTSRREAVSVERIVSQAALLAGTSFGKGVTLRTQVEPGLPPVFGDGDQLQQVLVNLILNARDAMAGRAGTVTLEAARGAPGRGDGAEGWVRVSVRDEGCGIAPELHDRIFDPFFTTKPVGRGTGLGLAIAFTVVRDHGGKIEVESAPDHGAAFHIHLPAAPPEALERPAETDGGGAPPVAAAAGEAAAATVLVVDDEPLVGAVGKEMLSRLGYTPLVVSSGEEALALLAERSEPIACVVLDLVMPGMPGLEVLRRLRADGREVPVVVASGHAPPGVAERLAAAGADGFLAKPYAPAELDRAVRAAIARRSQAAARKA
jgi:two-component system cell cycle sensor histidine kinase/response regulator CckA